MKVRICFFAITFASKFLLAQSKMELVNPIPRQGQEIEIEIDFINGKEKIASGKINIKPESIKSGKNRIGPMTVKINDFIFVTDSLNVNVQEKLPNDVFDGMWIRQLDNGETKYLVIEQRISNKLKTEKSRSQVTIGYSSENKHFKFKIEEFEDLGFEVINSTYSVKPEIFNNAVSLKTEIVKFRRVSDSSKKVKLTSRLFDDIGDFKIGEVWIE